MVLYFEWSVISILLYYGWKEFVILFAFVKLAQSLMFIVYGRLVNVLILKSQNLKLKVKQAPAVSKLS